MHLLSFAITSLPLLVRGLLWRPDVIWMAAPSIVCAPGALMAAKLCRAKTWLHVQDFEVDIGFGMGMISGGRWQRFALAIERNLLKRFDRLSTIGRAMMERAVDKGLDPERLVHIPNWVDLRTVSPDKNQGGTYRQELGIPAAAVVALYSGSMGIKQGVDLAAQAAVRLASVPNLHFIFCGGGALKIEVETITAGFTQIHHLPFQPVERLPELLATADIHLLPQRPVTSDLVLPSKLTGMLSSGRPIVVIAAEGTELADIGSTCGIAVAHGTVQLFADGVRLLNEQAAIRKNLGFAARRYAEDNFDMEAVMNKLLEHVDKLVSDDITSGIGNCEISKSSGGVIR